MKTEETVEMRGLEFGSGPPAGAPTHRVPREYHRRLGDEPPDFPPSPTTLPYE